MKTELVPLTYYSTHSYGIEREINEERWEDWFCQFCQINNRKQIPSWPCRFLLWSPSLRPHSLPRRMHTVNTNVRRKRLVHLLISLKRGKDHHLFPQYLEFITPEASKIPQIKDLPLRNLLLPLKVDKGNLQSDCVL